MMRRKKTEILAPAGSVQGLKAAIAAGCDAVYIGGGLFGARAYADNPAEKEMLEAIAYCHLHGVKLYMTVNTLLKDREMEELLFSFLRPYVEAGLDAVIVQDVGVLRFISRHFPELAIHASTQMTLTMGRGAEDLQKYHVTRIVPARELSIDELTLMRRDTELELEVFVHGALCYCYSGQCLFSSMLGGRSGNRGRCAQPCRMPYKISGQSGRGGEYLLSPKELCNLPFLPKLVEAGVDSFKIEGRMKRPEYTAFVVSVYRKYTDIYFDLGEEGYESYLLKHGDEWEEDLRRLAELYNRMGFTRGYLEGRAGNPLQCALEEEDHMLSDFRPNHGGVLVGKVLSVDTRKREVVYRTVKKLSAQDVVAFRNEGQQDVYEYTIGNETAAGQQVTARYQKGSRIKVGDKVYRTRDAALLKEIREKYLDRKMRLPLQAVFTARPGRPARLLVKEVSGGRREAFQAECSGEICQPAQSQPASEESVRRVLNQTGSSPFYFEKLDILMDGELFLPVGMLKKLRRQTLEELEQKIVSARQRCAVLESETERPAFQEEDRQCVNSNHSVFSASVMYAEQLEQVLQCKEIQTVYLHTEVMGEEELTEAYRRILREGKDPWLVLPVVFRAAVWKSFAEKWKKGSVLLSLDWGGYLVKNFESLHFLTGVVGVPGEKIRLDHNMYVMNEEACLFWREQGIGKFTLSLEETAEELAGLSFLPQSELLVYGRLPLMVSAQCVRANILLEADGQNDSSRAVLFRDRQGREFEAVSYCNYCYNVIYQREPLYIKEEALRSRDLRVGSMRYSFTTESGAQVREILCGRLEGKTNSGHFRLGIQ